MFFFWFCVPDPRPVEIQRHNKDKNNRFYVHGCIGYHRIRRTRGRSKMGPPFNPRRICPGIEKGSFRYKRAEFQPLRFKNGHQSWTHNCRRYRRPKTALRHMGKHRQCRVEDGEHGQSWMHSGIFNKLEDEKKKKFKKLFSTKKISSFNR